MVAFPAFKLAAIFLRQISKPVANSVKNRAKKSPFFRTYICMPPAQFYHWCDVKLKMWALNLGKPVKVAPLNENMAIELGAELLGEGIIFTIASSIFIMEYVRSSRKEAAKELERQQEIEQIQDELKELYFARAKQETQLKELVRALRIDLPSLHYAEPTSYNTDDIPEHYKNETPPEEDASIFTRLNQAIWTAVDFIIPPNESPPPQPKQTSSSPNVILVTVDEGKTSKSDSPTPENPSTKPKM